VVVGGRERGSELKRDTVQRTPWGEMETGDKYREKTQQLRRGKKIYPCIRLKKRRDKM